MKAENDFAMQISLPFSTFSFNVGTAFLLHQVNLTEKHATKVA